MADAHHDRPGEPPEIRDEAADTPMWVPAMGLALLIVSAVFLVWQSSGEPTPVEEAAEAAADAPNVDGEAPADEDVNQ
ncbi:MAG: hypothetical protein RLO52_25850 [Sandaracinaceae bacterium]|nr:MAG: hypothetical protein EVA89_34685 [Sandaracinaceae bacterium]